MCSAADGGDENSHACTMLYICLFVCLFLWLFDCVCDCVVVCLFICWCVCLCVSLFFRWFVFLVGCVFALCDHHHVNAHDIYSVCMSVVCVCRPVKAHELCYEHISKIIN